MTGFVDVRFKTAKAGIGDGAALAVAIEPVPNQASARAIGRRLPARLPVV